MAQFEGFPDFDQDALPWSVEMLAFFAALKSSHIGATLPDDPVEGMVAASTAVAGTIQVYQYAGAVWRLLYSVNTTSGAVTFAGLVVGADVLAPDGDGSGLSGLPSEAEVAANGAAIASLDGRVTTLENGTVPNTAVFGTELNFANVGGPTSGAYRTIPIASEFSNNIAGSSLNTNQIILPAGAYRVIGWQQFYLTNHSKVRLYNITDGELVVEGGSILANATVSFAGNAPIVGQFTLDDAKVLEFQSQVTASNATNGWGSNAGGGFPFRTCQLYFEKVA